MGSVARTVSDAIAWAAGHANIAASTRGFPQSGNPFFTFHACDIWEISEGLAPSIGYHGAVAPPEINWLAWNGTDTLVDFLNSQEPDAGWFPSWFTYPNLGPAARQADPAGGAAGYWQCEIMPWMLPYISGRALTGSVRPTTPPIWPGVDYVTLGTPVPLDDSFASQEPCNGALVSVSFVPARYGSYDWGALASYPHMVYLSFVTPEGHNEQLRPVVFTDEVVTPALMYDAGGFVGRAKPGVVGTATPWTINSTIGQ